MSLNTCLDIPVLPSPGSGECELKDKKGGLFDLGIISTGLPEDFGCFLNIYLSLLICEIGFSLPYGTLVTHKEISNR